MPQKDRKDRSKFALKSESKKERKTIYATPEAASSNNNAEH